MQFDSANEVVQLCAKGMESEVHHQPGKAKELLLQAWHKATNNFEKAYSRSLRGTPSANCIKKIGVNKTALEFALKLNDKNIFTAYPSLYLNIAKCYEDLNDLHTAHSNYKLALSNANYLPDDGYAKMIRSGIENGLTRTLQNQFKFDGLGLMLLAMEKNNFIDYIRIFCRSGHGGAGSKHFMRTKFNPKAGPDGGNGGRGGHIILRGNKQLWTLLHLRYYKNVIAENGGHGNKNNSTGADGKDIIIEVPLGTIARDEETEKTEAEILNDGDEIIWVHGGKGGLGNANFATATNQAPEYAQPGEPGIEGWKTLELKVLADVGLVGFPNAGKSTLLSVLTAAKPKIADYAFTTLTPQLGIVDYRDGKSFCIADLPGIIEGAAEGKGLGHRFLRHIERNAALLFLIPADSNNHKHEFEILLKELKEYNPEMLQKEFIIAISKSDILDEELERSIENELPKHIPHIFISSLINTGLNELKDLLWKTLNSDQINSKH